MTNKIINLKRDNKGGTYIELTFAILVIAMLLAIVVDFFPVFVKIKALNEYASYTARMIALEGESIQDHRRPVNSYRGF